MDMKKTVKEDVLPSCLQVTNDQSFIESPVKDLVMLWMPLISSTSFLILSNPKQSEYPQQDDFCAVVKRKHPLLKKAHRLECLKSSR